MLEPAKSGHFLVADQVRQNNGVIIGSWSSRKNSVSLRWCPWTDTQLLNGPWNQLSIYYRENVLTKLRGSNIYVKVSICFNQCHVSIHLVVNIEFSCCSLKVGQNVTNRGKATPANAIGWFRVFLIRSWVDFYQGRRKEADWLRMSQLRSTWVKILHLITMLLFSMEEVKKRQYQLPGRTLGQP